MAGILMGKALDCTRRRLAYNAVWSSSMRAFRALDVGGIGSS